MISEVKMYNLFLHIYSTGKISFSNFIHFFPHVKEYRITVFFSVRVCISNCVGWIKTERNRFQVIKGEKRHGAKITLFTVYQRDLRNLVIWLKNSFQSFLLLLQIIRNNSVESEGKRRRKLNYAVWLKKKKESKFIYFTHV